MGFFSHIKRLKIVLKKKFPDLKIFPLILADFPDWKKCSKFYVNSLISLIGGNPVPHKWLFKFWTALQSVLTDVPNLNFMGRLLEHDTWAQIFELLGGLIKEVLLYTEKP